ncbi:uncharacterized protein [Magallana gigas]|uniref:uncharacterized protein isoform X2 n=1 Tax=Magallana gigas TaxID=29159 RepID=UPI003342C72A
MSMANVKMESNAYLAFMMILSVQGEFISNFMLRNSSYGNRATYAINVIFTSNCRSLLDCASQCTAWGECKSVMFNMDTRQCQLLSVHMDDQSDAGPHTSVGWLYYERKTEDEPNTATETADLPTTVISTETSQSSSPNVATDLTTVVDFETTTTSEDEPNTATETADLPTTVISTETSQSSSPNVATDLTTVVDFETTTTSEDEPHTATETADLPTTVISTETSQSSSPNVATDLTTVVDFETTTTSDCSLWHYRFGHWYLLDSNNRTFNDSRTFCASLSPPSYVIEVQSQEENNWLIELTSTLCGVAYQYWLNGYDTDNSGTFTWIDSQTPSNYTNWYTGQPKDESGNGPDKCIASSTGYTGVWVDIPCSFTRPVVCERNF